MGKVASAASRMRFHCMSVYAKRRAVNLTHRSAVPPPLKGRAPHPPLRGPRDSPVDCHAPKGEGSSPTAPRSP